MTLFELQAWLGHRSPESTQHYAKITPNTLARACNDAGYFERIVRTIEVLVESGRGHLRSSRVGRAVAVLRPRSRVLHLHLPRAMACACCDFCTPKTSGKGQLLEAKDNLQRLLASVPLSDEERARRRRR